MSNLTKGLGVAVTALACWVAPCATAAQRTEAPAPPSWTPALPGERQPGAAERSRPADAPPADQGEGPSPRSARPAPDTPGETAPRKPQPARSRNTLRAAANGLGNTIVIDNGTGRSRTVIENTRNGVGNRVVIVDGEVVTDRPAPGRAGGNGLEFGDVRFFSPLHGCTLYWGPWTLTWYRYDADREEYVPAEWDY